MSCYTSRKVSFFLTASMIMLCLAASMGGGGMFLWLMFAVAAVDVIQLMMFYRCPHCRKSLPLRGGLPEFCPHCGEALIND